MEDETAALPEYAMDLAAPAEDLTEGTLCGCQEEKAPALHASTPPSIWKMNEDENRGAQGKKTDLDRMLGTLGDTFQERLFKLIDERGLADVEVYKRANLDRKLFSRIRNNVNYTT